LFSGRLGIGRALTGFLQALKKAGQRGGIGTATEADGFPQKMAEALAEFKGAVLVLLSGEDYTAKEFQTWLAQNDAGRKCLLSRRVTRHDIAAADHTFSRAVWRQEVEATTIAWLKGWERS
jgi:2-succinyl-5-enolpyruvyl-6-hydroxy-3-cyclohexene-1-carboxylate synthase